MKLEHTQSLCLCLGAFLALLYNNSLSSDALISLYHYPQIHLSTCPVIWNLPTKHNRPCLRPFSSPKTTLTLRVCFILDTQYTISNISSVYPAHLAFVLLNETGSESTMPGAPQPSGGGAPLFASVVSRAGGDPVRPYLGYNPCVYDSTFALYSRMSDEVSRNSLSAYQLKALRPRRLPCLAPP